MRETRSVEGASAQAVANGLTPQRAPSDEVAYLRYASVYRSFSSLEDFEGEIALLRAEPSRNSKALKLPSPARG